MNKKLTMWESACIITGYGIGGGVMAMPFFVDRCGFLAASIIIIVSFIFSYLLHIMIAEVCLNTNKDAQIVEIFSHYLFKGKFKNVLTIAFFVLMALVLFTNLAAYIAGAGEIISELFGISIELSRILFYVVAALVVFFGLKAVGVSEKIAVALIFVMIIGLGVLSFFNIQNTISFTLGKPNEMLALFGMAMFSFSAFFSIPQAVSGLDGDKKKINKAVFWGLFNNLILIFIISIASLIASSEITDVAIIGLTSGIGGIAKIIGSLFTVLAMLTTYWSISLALSDIVKSQLKINSTLCWLIATLPSFIITFLGFGGFMDFMRTAGGVIAIIVALMVIPVYRISRKDDGVRLLGDKMGGTTVQILLAIAYIFMAIGSVVTI